MKNRSNPDLAKAVNETAFLLSQQTFGRIRETLRAQVRDLLAGGATVEQALEAIRQAGMGQRSPRL